MAPSIRDESERETRRTRIDPQLTAQGWEVVPYDPNRPIIAYTNHAVTEFPTDGGPADYGLFVAGRHLGIVEGKRVTLGPQNALTQSERYSKGVRNSPFNFRGFRVPFLYSTNGEIFWFHDVRDPLNRARRVATFHTPAALQEMMGRNFSADCSWFAENANAHDLRPGLRHGRVPGRRLRVAGERDQGRRPGPRHGQACARQDLLRPGH